MCRLKINYAERLKFYVQFFGVTIYLGVVQARFIQHVIKTRKYGGKLPQYRILL